MNNKFNQFFVIRDYKNTKTDIEKLFDVETIDCEIKFVCLYDYNYAVLNLNLDQQNQLVCSLEHIKRYALTNPVTPKSEDDDEVFPETTKDLPKRYDSQKDNKIAAALKR